MHYRDAIERARRRHGARLDTAELDAASQFKRWHHGTRVRVETRYPSGETFVRTGTVSMTTGWRPAFLLMHRSNAHGSWDVLSERDHVVAVWDGRRYVDVQEDGRS